MRKTGFFFLMFLLFSSNFLLAETTVSSTIDKRAAVVGEEIHLTIRIENAQGNLQAPRLPALRNFESFYTGRASHITFSNSQASSSVEFSYVLVPKVAGRYTIPGIEVLVGTERFVADPIDIEIGSSGGSSYGASAPQTAPPSVFGSGASPNQGSTAPPPFPAPAQPPPYAGSALPPSAYQPPPPGASAGQDDNIFVRAWVDKTEVYPNEQVLLTYALYTRYDTRYEGFDKEPEVSGFWIEDFPMDRDIQRETVRMNGKRYVKADIKKTALFPTSPADYTIQPGTIKVSIRQEPESNSVFDEFFNDSFFSGGSFFARREDRILSPPPITVKVRPFPERGKPESFQGAVGNFRLSATVDKESVKQNEPVSMKMVIEGEGNIETLNKPKIPEIQDFKVYEADSSSQLFKTGNIIGGKKSFEVVFIPTRAGQMKIPALEFSFFNPATSSYNRVSTPEFNLTVAPSTQTFKMPENLSQQDAFKKDIQLEAKDIRYIDERLPGQKAETALSWTYHILMTLDGLAFFAVLAGIFYRRQEMIFARDNALKRRKLARQTAEARIRRLKSRESGYFEDVEKILTQYLSDKFDLSAYGATRFDLERQLEQSLGREDQLFREIQELYQLCEESRFAKAQVPEESKTKALKILRDTIARVERMRR